MGRYIGPKNKIARRFGVNLGLKSNPTKVARRLQQAPGVHGPNKRKSAGSTFGKQLLEKQKAKLMYGLRERQFRRYVTEATRLTGDSSIHLQHMLEMRLDNVIYRSGLAITRAQARQFVSHGMFTVNGKLMNVPSHIVSVGDVITLKENKKRKKIFETASEMLSKHEMPSWLSADASTLSVKVTSKPGVLDTEKIYDIKLIIEYYSTR
ncbi:MAG: 30S ribosomal protein S4 [Candidatus Magasanikbacteria bacterium]|nr:30S ribosomal protein S4 [Candidatus Magasanikbacteria bacterium]